MRLSTVVCAALCVLLVGAMSVGAQSAPPAQPTNLEVVAATQDSIILAWGPAQPGAFYVAGEGKNYVMVAWGVSQDSRGPVTYELRKDGAVLATGIATNTYRVAVPPNRKATSFRTCVTAVLADGRRSPTTCGTFSRT